MKRIFTLIKLYITIICQNLIFDLHFLSENLQISHFWPENTTISYPCILKSISVSLSIFHTVSDIGIGIVCINSHQLEIKTEEIMQNRQKEVEKRKTYIPLNLVHPVHTHHISQNQFLRRFGIQIYIQEKSANAK